MNTNTLRELQPASGAEEECLTFQHAMLPDEKCDMNNCVEILVKIKEHREEFVHAQ